jgi:Transposase family tnp2
LTVLFSFCSSTGPTAFKNLDPFLALLVEEFQQLWLGVPCRDVSIPEGEEGHEFQLRAMPISVTADLPGQGTASGYKVSGYSSCFNCGPEMQGQWSKHMRKIHYHGEHRRELDSLDPLRRNRTEWPDVEKRVSPKPLSQSQWKLRAKKVEKKELDGTTAGIHRWSILNELPYWEVSLLICLPSSFAICTQMNANKVVYSLQGYI